MVVFFKPRVPHLGVLLQRIPRVRVYVYVFATCILLAARLNMRFPVVVELLVEAFIARAYA